MNLLQAQKELLVQKSHLATKEKFISILESRETKVQHAITHFVNSSSCDYDKFQSEFDCSMEENNYEFSEKCKQLFGAGVGEIMRKVTSESNYDYEYGGFIDTLDPSQFSDYVRLETILGTIEDRIAIRENELADLENKGDVLEFAIEELSFYESAHSNL